MKNEISIRTATVNDIFDIVRLRRIMFESMGFDNRELLDESDRLNAEYFRNNIPSKNFYGWVAHTSEGNIVGTVGFVIDQYPPSPNNLTGKRGYIMNLCVDVDYRRQGIARQLMNATLDYTNKINIIVTDLRATEVGRGLYTELGYKNSNAMRLTR